MKTHKNLFYSLGSHLSSVLPGPSAVVCRMFEQLRFNRVGRDRGTAGRVSFRTAARARTRPASTFPARVVSAAALLLLAAALALAPPGNGETAHAQGASTGADERLLESPRGRFPVPGGLAPAHSDARDRLASGGHGSGEMVNRVSASRCPEPALNTGDILIEGARRADVGSFMTGSRIYFGYNNSEGEGTLDDATFTTNTTATEYTIEIIATGLTGGLKQGLVVVFDKALATADKRALALYVCGNRYPLSEFTLWEGTTTSYYLDTPAEDWPFFAERTFYISDDVAAASRCPEPALNRGDVPIESARRVGIGSFAVTGTRTYYGHNIGTGAGTLDDATFRTNATATDYTIEIISTGLTGGLKQGLVVVFDKPLAAADKKALSLYVCGEHYPLSEFTLWSGTESSYYLDTPAEDWSIRSERIIRIGEDNGGPTFVEGWVNGTSLVIAFDEKLGAAAALANSRFSVTKGSSDDTVTLSSTAPSVAGSMVTLTLATDAAITASDTNMKVGYSKPSSGTGNRVVDKAGNQAAGFSGKPVVNELADTVAPRLVTTDPAVLAANGRTLTLTMNEAMRISSVPAASAFTVEATPSGGSEAVVALDGNNPVTVNGSRVRLKLGTPIAHNDADVKVSYAVPGSGGKLKDAAGNDLAAFTDRSVRNYSAIPRVGLQALQPDMTPGIALARYRLTRSRANSDMLLVPVRITQSETYFPTTFVEFFFSGDQAFEDHYLNSNYLGNTSGDVTVTVLGDETHVPMLTPRNSATVQMKVPATGASVQMSHQQSTGLTVAEGAVLDAGVVARTGAGVARPRDLIRASALTGDGTTTSGVDYTPINQGVSFAASGWTDLGNDTYMQTSRYQVQTIDDEEYEGDETFEVYFAHSPGTSYAVAMPPQGQDRVTVTIRDNDTLGVSAIQVASTAANGYYKAGDAIRFAVEFNGAVSVTGTPHLDIDLGGQARRAQYAGGSNSKRLVFAYTVQSGDGDDHDGISWNADPLSANGDAIKFVHADPGQQLVARLSHGAQEPLSDHKVDTLKPALERAEVAGATLTLTYSETLNTAAPASSAFTVRVGGGSGVNPTRVSISGAEVVLTLGATVDLNQDVTLSYQVPATNPIQDRSGATATFFINRMADHASDLDNFRAAPGNRQVTLEWDRITSVTLTRYQYRYRSTTDAGWNPDWRNVSGSNANTTSYRAGNLTNGIEYTLQVRPVYTRNAQDEFGQADEVKAVPRGQLTAPRGLEATWAGDGEIALTWDDPNDITITGYQYRYRNPFDSGWNPDWTGITGSGAYTTSHILDGLTNNVLYTVELRAMRGTEGGPARRVTQRPRGPLVVPVNFTATSGQDRQATLSWDPSVDDSITQYQYRYRVNQSEAQWNPGWTRIPNSRWTTTSYTVRNLVNDTTYVFEVRAVRGMQEGPASRDTATPEGSASLPLPPAELTVHPGDGNLGLEWDPPLQEDPRAPVTGYRVRYRQQGGSSWTNVSRSDPSLRVQTISGLTNGHTYEVGVTSVNSVGTGLTWTAGTGTPTGSTDSQSPPGPEGSPSLNVGPLSSYWLDSTGARNHPQARNSYLTPDSCSVTLPILVIWGNPEGKTHQDFDEWQAHITPGEGIERVTHRFVLDGRYVDLHGSVTMNPTDGRASLTIRIRGREDDTWGTWSRPSSLLCSEN